MNLERARVVLRPRTQSEIFDLAARFCVGLGGPLYLRLALATLLPCLLLTGAVWYWAKGEWVLVWWAALTLAALAEGAYTIAASRLLFEARPRARDVLRQLLRRSPAYLFALFLIGLMFLLGSFVVVLGVLAWIVYTFVPEALLLEGQGPLASLRRARVLIHRKFGAALGVRFGCLAAQFFAVFAADALLGDGLVDFVLQLGHPLGALWDDGGSLFALVGLFAAAPYVATVRFLAYIDGRTRQDGWDIQLRFTAIAAAAQATREPTAEEAA